MQSPSIQESLHSRIPEGNLNSVVKVSQPNRAVEGWRETCWFLRRDKDDLEGYVFDSELMREGSD